MMIIYNIIKYKTYRLILVTLLIFHFEISGKDDNDTHPLNISPLLIIFLIFHFEIFGKDDNDLHSKNIQIISLTLLVLHSEISGKDDNELLFSKTICHFSNIICIMFASTKYTNHISIIISIPF